MKNFLNQPMALVQSPHKGAYQTQSGAIQGILADMMDSFTRDYASTLEEEKTKQTDFDNLMATKTDDLKKLEKALADKTLNEGNDPSSWRRTRRNARRRRTSSRPPRSSSRPPPMPASRRRTSGRSGRASAPRSSRA
jgi:hypothetical protein